MDGARKLLSDPKAWSAFGAQLAAFLLKLLPLAVVMFGWSDETEKVATAAINQLAVALEHAGYLVAALLGVIEAARQFGMPPLAAGTTTTTTTVSPTETPSTGGPVS